ncbi:hypothetical protein IT6_08510 [Methylacidiphilum caldifontis]|uniref:hypothetical protein n=1 Tax=Methylacidiphilum caldifontis TaxID=2795386 RepID=UPI001A8CF891|nr:hypothetical protein [Methylacidiphilum caldifontis]QSR88408.1 hypothetical protein IT6_08510 [Methylacidiphilum caldifontis]
MDNKKNSKSNPKVRLDEARARFIESVKRVSDNLSKENTLLISLIVGIAVGLLLYSLRWFLSKVTRMGFFYYILQQVWKMVWKNIQKEFTKDQSTEGKAKDSADIENPPSKK